MGLPLLWPPVESDVDEKTSPDRSAAHTRSSIRRQRVDQRERRLNQRRRESMRSAAWMRNSLDASEVDGPAQSPHDPSTNPPNDNNTQDNNGIGIGAPWVMPGLPPHIRAYLQTIERRENEARRQSGDTESRSRSSFPTLPPPPQFYRSVGEGTGGPPGGPSAEDGAWWGIEGRPRSHIPPHLTARFDRSPDPPSHARPRVSYRTRHPDYSFIYSEGPSNNNIADANNASTSGSNHPNAWTAVFSVPPELVSADRSTPTPPPPQSDPDFDDPAPCDSGCESDGEHGVPQPPRFWRPMRRMSITRRELEALAAAAASRDGANTVNLNARIDSTPSNRAAHTNQASPTPIDHTARVQDGDDNEADSNTDVASSARYLPVPTPPAPNNPWAAPPLHDDGSEDELVVERQERRNSPASLNRLALQRSVVQFFSMFVLRGRDWRILSQRCECTFVPHSRAVTSSRQTVGLDDPSAAFLADAIPRLLADVETPNTFWRHIGVEPFAWGPRQE